MIRPRASPARFPTRRHASKLQGSNCKFNNVVVRDRQTTAMDAKARPVRHSLKPKPRPKLRPRPKPNYNKANLRDCASHRTSPKANATKISPEAMRESELNPAADADSTAQGAAEAKHLHHHKPH